MRMKILASLAVVTFLLGTTSFGAYIDFTGGTATLWDASTVVPDTTQTWGSSGGGLVDFYVENGFKLDFIGDYGIIGNYYGGGNDVIHGHWSTGAYGGLTEIRVTKTDGTAFDLNYFVLTSNTERVGGTGADSGNELAYIKAYADGSTLSYTQQLPTDDWGWAGSNPQINLGANFDSIKKFTFTVSNHVDCFGMDNFYIDEQPPWIPAPGAILLGSIGVGLVGWLRRRRTL